MNISEENYKNIINNEIIRIKNYNYYCVNVV